MLYETAARASEVLALDVEDLDRARRWARIGSKGGSVDMVVWAALTARLLGCYVTDRTGGPLFLTRWRSRTAPARRDLYEATGQARLSYRTAAAEFRKHSGGWTLHQLRHSSLTHLAEAGVSAVMLQAKSRHRDLRTLSVYTKPGVEAVPGWMCRSADRRGSGWWAWLAVLGVGSGMAVDWGGLLTVPTAPPGWVCVGDWP
ncbi:MAG: site-specific integrase [bacterium]|nr:site-specific integrase [bacterium]